ncbi:MAG TPA: phosphohistidine phosphatase SixA [Steroidobacteraceae bacterium]|jgi:phosphohistidine phosphatase|nr:phosphohistidine phosphatase SixA [Steroidobacteraceae bacterium]
MELLIIRHAIAFERDRHRWRNDGARPLSPAGMRRSRKAAAGLKELSKAPDRLLTSPLIRARQTAKILTEVAGWPPAEEAPELLPGEAALAVLSLLAKDRSRRVALVGHQPGLGALLSACLLGNDAVVSIEMKKNAVACVSFEGAARPGRAVLNWLATPRMLRGLRHA